MQHRIGIGQLRSDTLRYVHRAATGDTIEVLRRGRLVAELQAPIDAPPALGDAERAYCDRVMIAVDVSLIRSQAGRYFDRVAAGEALEIMHHGHTIARICPRAADVAAKPRRLRRPTPLEDRPAGKRTIVCAVCVRSSAHTRADGLETHSSVNPMMATGRARVAPSVFRSIRIGPPRMGAPRPRCRHRPCSCNAFPPARS
jgi:antitoxin (DNA-binding transcriptional repressor) of toxin-antitoxin stability system